MLLWLADAVFALHCGFVLFVVFGGFAVLLVPRLAWLHVPAVVWAVLAQYADWTCPLTPLENVLRERGGGASYSGGFLAHYLAPLLYPAGLTRRHHVVLGTFVAVLNVGIYARLRSRRPRSIARVGWRAGSFVFAVTLVSLTAVVPSAAERITFGVQMAPEKIGYDEIVRTAKLVEELGYDHFWLNDHFIPILGDKDGAHFESWTMLTAVATQTERIRLGLLVAGNTYRHPAVLAKMATTLDHVSRGRLSLGLGAGWEEFEHRAYGIPFHSAKERAERLGEALEVITRLWREHHPTFEGKYYSLFAAPFAPKPVQSPHPPIVVGGQGKRWIMPLVARYADEWNVPVGVSPEGMRERLGIVRAECERLRREPCVRGVSVFLPLANITRIPLAGPVTRLGARLMVDERAARSVLAGSASDIKARLREYVDAGATSFIITTRPSIDHDLMRRFATEVAAELRPAAVPAPRP